MRIEKIILDKAHNSDVTAYLTEDYHIDGEKSVAPAVIICPGGGWFSLSEREGEPVALAFVNQGFQAFVFHYGVEEVNNKKAQIVTDAISDLDKAVQIIQERYQEFRVDRNRMVLLGFSAGGQLAALYGNQHFSGIKAVVLCYPLCDMESVIRYMKSKDIVEDDRKILEKAYSICGNDTSPIQFVNPNTPPTFIWHTANDTLLPVENTLHYAQKLAENGIPFELHVYEKGAHGLSLGKKHSACTKKETNSYCAQWFEALLAWMKERNITDEED